MTSGFKMMISGKTYWKTWVQPTMSKKKTKQKASLPFLMVYKNIDIHKIFLKKTNIKIYLL
jgi:hypothetical protein